VEQFFPYQECNDVARSNCLHLLLNLVNAQNYSLLGNTLRCKLHFQSSVGALKLTAIWFIQPQYVTICMFNLVAKTLSEKSGYIIGLVVW